MLKWLDLSALFQWLVNGDNNALPVLEPSEALALGSVILLLTAAILVTISIRDKARRAERSKQHEEDERNFYRWRRM